MIQESYGLEGKGWDFVVIAESSSEVIGYSILIIFILGWGSSALVYYMCGYDKLENSINESETRIIAMSS